jgi:hypothetical protein
MVLKKNRAVDWHYFHWNFPSRDPARKLSVEEMITGEY